MNSSGSFDTERCPGGQDRDRRGFPLQKNGVQGTSLNQSGTAEAMVFRLLMNEVSLLRDGRLFYFLCDGGKDDRTV